MFKKAAFTLVFVTTTIFSNHVYTMERELGSQKLPENSYVSLINSGNTDCFPEALNEANICSKNCLHFINDTCTELNCLHFINDACAEFKFIRENAQKSCDIYIALLGKGYQDALQPALNFAEMLGSYSGSKEIYISDFGSDYSHSSDINDTLKKDLKLVCLVYAAKIYVAFLENAKKYIMDVDSVKKVLDCANKVQDFVKASKNLI